MEHSKEIARFAAGLKPSDGSLVAVDDASDHPLRITEYGKGFVVTDPEQLSQLDMKTKLAILHDPVLYSRLPEPAKVLLKKLTTLSDHDRQTLAVIPHDDGRSEWTRGSRVPRAVSEQERVDLSTTLGLDATGDASWEEINDGLRMKTMLETLRPSGQRATARADDVEEELRAAADAPREVVEDEGTLVDEVGALYLNHRTPQGALALADAFRLALPAAPTTADHTAPAPAPASAPVSTSTKKSSWLFACMSSHAKLLTANCEGSFVRRLAALFTEKPSMITKKTYRCPRGCEECSSGTQELPPANGLCACEYIRGLPRPSDIIAVCICDATCQYCIANAASLLCPCEYAKLGKTSVAFCPCDRACKHCYETPLDDPTMVLHKIDEEPHHDLFPDNFDDPDETAADPADSPADDDYDYEALRARRKELRKRRRKLKKKLGPSTLPLMSVTPWWTKLPMIR